MAKKREFFPIGDKGFVSFEDLPLVHRNMSTIRIIGDVEAPNEFIFDTHELAIAAMEALWIMYDEEQMLRNGGSE